MLKALTLKSAETMLHLTQIVGFHSLSNGHRINSTLGPR